MIEIGVRYSFKEIANQGHLPKREQRHVHIIEYDKTLCNQDTLWWHKRDVHTLDGVEWLCNNCRLVVEKRERDRIAREARRARLAALPVQGRLEI